MKESSSINNIAGSISYNTLSPRGHNIKGERGTKAARHANILLLLRPLSVRIHTVDLDDGRTLRKVGRDDDLHKM